VTCDISYLSVSAQPRDKEQVDAHLNILNNITYMAQATVRLENEMKMVGGTTYQVY
jgi:hypothetical protein